MTTFYNSVRTSGSLPEHLKVCYCTNCQTPLSPGDVITITSRPQEFYYIGGRIGYPGQKVFQSGASKVCFSFTPGFSLVWLKIIKWEPF